jgi:histidinol-phosphate aminotransferase
MIEQSVRPEMLDFDPYVAGLSIEEIRERFGLTEIVKLASNENPLGTSPLARKAAAAALERAFRYPITGCPRLVQALAAQLDLPEAMIVAGNGSDEIIDLLFRVKARPGRDHVICYEHSFSMYRLTAKLCGVGYREVPRGEKLALPLDGLAEVAGDDTAMVFVTTPDNPSGHTARAEELAVLAGVLPKNALLVLDEAYMDFSWPPEDFTLLPLAREFPNVVILRTFSKAYGLAGLRLGYGIMPEWLAEYVRRARIPFTVNLAAEEAGIAALTDEAFYLSTLDVVLKGREYLFKELSRLGCEPTPSQANFLMFKPPVEAQRVFEELLERGVIVRWLKSFGLPGHIRVSVGTARENAIFVRALEAVLGR